MPRIESKSGGAAGVTGLPLSGILIADFSRLLPGPWCSQFLGDLGAQVVKIEQPGMGDPSRYNPPRYRNESVYFHGVNANKESLVLDLTRSEGVKVAHRLLERSDVVIESFRPGVTSKLKIDYGTVKGLKPDVIYCAISGFGHSGPLSNIPGHDLVVQAMSGILEPRNGSEIPMPHFQVADYAAATMACIGILAAILRRNQSGEGSYIDLSMFDSVMSMANISLLSGLSRLAGGTGTPMLEAWGRNPRYALYVTKDGGHVSVCLLEAKLWSQFCRTIGRDDLIDGNESLTDRHSSHGDRSNVYREAIAEYCRSKTRDELMKSMFDLGIPIMPVLSSIEALQTEHAKARDVAGVVDNEREGQVSELRNPLRLAGLTRAQRRPAPSFGADSSSILGALGYSQDDIRNLAEKKII